MTAVKKAVKKAVVKVTETPEVVVTPQTPLVEVEFHEGKRVVSSEIVGQFRDITVEGGITYRVDNK